MRILLAILLLAYTTASPQPKNETASWKPWFINSVKDFRPKANDNYKSEITEILNAQKNLTEKHRQQILFWNAGSPGYRWQDLMSKTWITDTSYNGALAFMLLSASIYDATLAAWDSKYSNLRPRPFSLNKKIKCLIPKPESPSYPCEYSVAAGVAVTIFSHFYPHLADSINNLAQQQMQSRIAAGVSFPSDTKAGFALGKQIAEIEINHTKDFVNKQRWDGKIPNTPNTYNGKFTLFPLAGNNKTVILTSANQFRPAAPPDFAKEMEELKNFKQTYRSRWNAYYWANIEYWQDALNEKIFEYNIHLNPLKAAQLYAIVNIAMYDGFVACFDAKYAYWGIRPNQYDTTFKSLIPTPPFPGYPSGHAAASAGMCEVLSFFFPEDKSLFEKKAKDAAESRFQAGIHFRSDNEAGLTLGKKVGQAVVERMKHDGYTSAAMP